MIANPEYSEDSQLYSYEDFGVIGLDLWQVSCQYLKTFIEYFNYYDKEKP